MAVDKRHVVPKMILKSFFAFNGFLKAILSSENAIHIN